MTAPLIYHCPPPLKLPLYPSILVENVIEISCVVWLFESHNTCLCIQFCVFGSMINDISVYKCINALDKQNPSN